MLTQPVGQVCAVVNGSGQANTDVAVQCATPAAGDLDSTFGDDGIVIAELSATNDVINAIAIQSDGKIVAAGYVLGTDFDFAVTRFNEDGSIDRSFATNGSYVGGFQTGTDAAQAERPRRAFHDHEMLVARVTTNGTLDTSFGTDGIGVYDLGLTGAIAQTVAIQPDGKYVAAGFVWDGTRNRSALIRVVP